MHEKRNERAKQKMRRGKEEKDRVQRCEHIATGKSRLCTCLLVGPHYGTSVSGKSPQYAHGALSYP